MNRKAMLKLKTELEGTLRSVSYLRYSDHKQDGGTSIETQKDAYDAYVEEKGYIHVADYIDEAKSASKNIVGRENFIRLLEDAKRGLFDIVLIFKFSRVFRNQYEAHFYEHELEKHGVKLVSITEPIEDTIEGRLMKGVIHAFNEFTSNTIAFHVSSSMLTLAKKGYFLGSVPLFGYDAIHDGLEGRRYKINEEEAKVVKELFNLFCEGLSLGDIARLFSKRGYKTRKYKKRGGKPFGEKTLRDMLTNSHYIGTYSYQPKDGEKIVRENNHEAIIDFNTWLAVQERLKASVERTPKPRSNKKRTFYLTGKITCEYCGASCTGSTGRWKYKGKTHYRPYYHCGNRRQARGDCPAKTMRKDELEPFVFEQIKKHFLNQEAIKEISKHVFENIEEAGGLDNVNELERQLEEALAQLSEAMDATINMKLPATARKMWARKTELISEEVEKLELAIKRAEHSLQVMLTPAKVEEYLLELMDAYEKNTESEEVLKLLVNIFVEKITLSNEEAKLELRFSVSDISALNATAGFPVFRLSVRKEKQ